LRPSQDIPRKGKEGTKLENNTEKIERRTKKKKKEKEEKKQE